MLQSSFDFATLIWIFSLDHHLFKAFSVTVRCLKLYSLQWETGINAWIPTSGTWTLNSWPSVNCQKKCDFATERIRAKFSQLPFHLAANSVPFTVQISISPAVGAVASAQTAMNLKSGSFSFCSRQLWIHIDPSSDLPPWDKTVTQSINFVTFCVFATVVCIWHLYIYYLWF